MNRRQFFQGVVAVVAMPEVKAPFRGVRILTTGLSFHNAVPVRYYDVCSAYPAAMLKEFHERIVADVKSALYKGGRVVYMDTDSVFIVGGK